MDKTEKLAFFKNLENNPRVTGLWCCPDLLEKERENSVWYDNEVLTFVVDNRYVYSCRAFGDVRITHIPTNDDVVSKGFQANRVVEFLEKHSLMTDDEVNSAETKGDIYFGDNNWFEDLIYDRENKEYIDLSGTYISNGPFAINLNYIDEWIKWYKEENGGN